MAPNQIFLFLGCNGKSDGDFIFCSKTDSPILEISLNLEKSQEIVQYFKGLGLFQREMVDYNGIRRVIYNLQDKYYQNCKPIWNDKFFKLLDKFTLMHKECGLVLSIGKV